MPIYEYRCESCGSTKELILRPGQDARPSCPSCRKRMRRIISPTAFILKGSGWYVTDYPSQDRKKGLEAEKGGGGEKKEKGSEKKSSPSKEKPTSGKGTKAASGDKAAKKSSS